MTGDVLAAFAQTLLAADLLASAVWCAWCLVVARYPLHGSRPQNRVSYVPITERGRVVDRPDAYSRLTSESFEAWLRWLLRQGTSVR